MASLRFKVQKITSGYLDMEVSDEDLKALTGAHEGSIEIARKIRECALYRAVNFDDKVVWESREHVKKEISECPVIIYDFTDPVVIGEAVEDAGNGKKFLTYKIRTMENGKPSIIYGFYAPEVDVVTYRRVSVLDPFPAYYSGLEEWCAIEEDLTNSQEFAKLTREIMERGKAYASDPEGYCPMYPVWGNTYDKNAVYEGEGGYTYTHVIGVFKMGRTTWYGCPVEIKRTKPNRASGGYVEAGENLYRIDPTPLSVHDNVSETETAKTPFEDPKVVSEEIAYTGGGTNYLIYEVAVKEDGMDSVLYAIFNSDDYEFMFQRASFFDPYETEGNEEWCDVPKGIDKDPQFFGILSELKKSTKMMSLGLYRKKYPERVCKYDPRITYADPSTGKAYTQVFSMKKKGETVLYGYPVDKKTSEVDYDHVVRIGAGPLVLP